MRPGPFEALALTCACAGAFGQHGPALQPQPDQQGQTNQRDHFLPYAQGKGQHAADKPCLAATALHRFSAQPPPLPSWFMSSAAGQLSMLLALQLAPCTVAKQWHWPVAEQGPLTVPEHTAVGRQQAQAEKSSTATCMFQGIQRCWGAQHISARCWGAG
jgi:hypothetical protein